MTSAGGLSCATGRTLHKGVNSRRLTQLRDKAELILLLKSTLFTKYPWSSDLATANPANCT